MMPTERPAALSVTLTVRAEATGTHLPSSPRYAVEDLVATGATWYRPKSEYMHAGTLSGLAALNSATAEGK